MNKDKRKNYVQSTDTIHNMTTIEDVDRKYLLFEEIADLSFERELSDLDAPYRAQRDLDTVYGDDAGYQYIADWITE